MLEERDKAGARVSKSVEWASGGVRGPSPLLAVTSGEPLEDRAKDRARPRVGIHFIKDVLVFINV